MNRAISGFLMTVMLLGVMAIGANNRVDAQSLHAGDPARTAQFKAATTRMAAKEFRTSSAFSRGIQGIFGVNTIAKSVVSAVIERAIRKKVQGDVDINIKSYSGIDLANGKAKQFRLKANNVVYDKTVFISWLWARSDIATPLWFDTKTGKPFRAFDTDFEVLLSENDLNRILASKEIKDKLNSIRIKMGNTGKQEVSLTDTTIDLVPDRIRMQGKVAFKSGSNAGKPVELAIESGMAPDPATALFRFYDIQLTPISGFDESGIDTNDMSPFETVLETMANNVLKPNKIIPTDKGSLTISGIKITHDALVVNGRIHVNALATP